MVMCQSRSVLALALPFRAKESDGIRQPGYLFILNFPYSCRWMSKLVDALASARTSLHGLLCAARKMQWNKLIAPINRGIYYLWNETNWHLSILGRFPRNGYILCIFSTWAKANAKWFISQIATETADFKWVYCGKTSKKCARIMKTTLLCKQ